MKCVIFCKFLSHLQNFATSSLYTDLKLIQDHNKQFFNDNLKHRTKLSGKEGKERMIINSSFNLKC